ncbi:IS5 family transposase [Streptomyces hirsutus]|uniref:IS5 family transposase n=1 Tax=Streptomyces hirsutus TaxID=35620 RepID=UPI0036914436
MVQGLARQGFDAPFVVGVHPRSPRRGPDDLDPLGCEDRVEGHGVLRVPVADQEARRVDAYARLDGEVAGLPHRPDEGLGRSRGSPTSKIIHLAGEGDRCPLTLLITPGQWGDSPQLIPVLERIRVKRPNGGHPRTRPDHSGGDKVCSSRRNRRYLRRRQIKHTIPEPKDQRANRRRRGSRGGRPAGFDKEMYKRRNEVERTINRLKHSRAVTTRYDKHAYVFHGTVTVASIRLWLRS